MLILRESRECYILNGKWHRFLQCIECDEQHVGIRERWQNQNKLYIITSGSLVFSLHHNAIAAAHCRQLFPH